MKTIISSETAYKGGLVASLLALAVVGGMNYQRINQTLEQYVKSQETLNQRFERLDEKLSANTQAIAELKNQLVPPSGSAMSTEPPDEQGAGPRRYYYSCAASAPAGWRVDSKCRLYKL